MLSLEDLKMDSAFELFANAAETNKEFAGRVKSEMETTSKKFETIYGGYSKDITKSVKAEDIFKANVDLANNLYVESVKSFMGFADFMKSETEVAVEKTSKVQNEMMDTVVEQAKNASNQVSSAMDAAIAKGHEVARHVSEDLSAGVSKVEEMAEEVKTEAKATTRRRSAPKA